MTQSKQQCAVFVCFVLKFIAYLLEFVICDLTNSIQKSYLALQSSRAKSKITEPNDKYKDNELKDVLFGIVYFRKTYKTIKKNLCVNLFYQCVQYFMLFGKVFSSHPHNASDTKSVLFYLTCFY